MLLQGAFPLSIHCTSRRVWQKETFLKLNLILYLLTSFLVLINPLTSSNGKWFERSTFTFCPERQSRTPSAQGISFCDQQGCKVPSAALWFPAMPLFNFSNESFAILMMYYNFWFLNGGFYFKFVGEKFVEIQSPCSGIQSCWCSNHLGFLSFRTVKN